MENLSRKKPIKIGKAVFHIITINNGLKRVSQYTRDAVVVSYDSYHDEYEIDYGPVIVCGVSASKIVKK